MADPAPRPSGSGTGSGRSVPPTRGGVPPGWAQTPRREASAAGAPSAGGRTVPSTGARQASGRQATVARSGAPATGRSAPGSPGAPTRARRAAPAPAQRRTWRRERVRVVHDVSSRRLVRRIDTWTVLKVSFVFYACLLVVFLTSGIILWNVAAAFGIITNIQKLVRSLFALTSFKLHPSVLLEWFAVVGVIFTILGSMLNVLAALIYNLISDVVGGIQVIVASDPAE